MAGPAAGLVPVENDPRTLSAMRKAYSRRMSYGATCWSGVERRKALSPASAHVFGDDLRPEGEHLGGRWVDRDLYPMCVRVAKCLDTREVFESPIILGAKERLVRAISMCVPVEKNCRLGIRLHLLG
jgi:hypothetical protein